MHEKLKQARKLADSARAMIENVDMLMHILNSTECKSILKKGLHTIADKKLVKSNQLVQGFLDTEDIVTIDDCCDDIDDIRRDNDETLALVWRFERIFVKDSA